MKRRTLLTAGVVGAASVSGCLGIITGGGGGGSTPAQETLEPTGTDTAADTASATDSASGTDTASATDTATGTSTGTASGATPDIDFQASVENIEKCGRTCRTLFYTVVNRGNDDAAGVGVRIRVFTGGDKVYDEVQEIGPLDARSKREGIEKGIDVGLGGAAKIKSNDGEVTIELRPEADSGVSEQFSFDRTLDA